VSVFRRVRVSTVVERIHPSVVLNVWISRAAPVSTRVVVLGQRFLSMRTGSALWRLLVSTHVLLCVGISAHELLRARLVRPGRILPNRLFGIAVIPLSGLVLPRRILLNGLVVADVVRLDRIVRAMSALLRVLIAIRISLMD